MAGALSEVANYWLSEPARAFQAQTRLMAGYLGLWTAAAQRLATTGEPAADTPAAAPDKRFADPEWQRNLFSTFCVRPIC